MEYYFGNFDPGEGNGTQIVAFDEALDSAVEEVFRNQATWDVASGPILFNIRAKDADGNAKVLVNGKLEYMHVNHVRPVDRSLLNHKNR